MTVKDLIKELRKYEQDRIVICSGDAEGNAFSFLTGISMANYDKISEEIGLAPEELTEDMEKEGWTKEDIVDGIPVVILWPGD